MYVSNFMAIHLITVEPYQRLRTTNVKIMVMLQQKKGSKGSHQGTFSGNHFVLICPVDAVKGLSHPISKTFDLLLMLQEKSLKVIWSHILEASPHAKWLLCLPFYCNVPDAIPVRDFCYMSYPSIPPFCLLSVTSIICPVFIFWESLTFEHMAIYQIAVEIFQSGRKRWTNRPKLPV